VFVGCSDDDSTTVNPPSPPETNLAGSIGVYADVNGTDRDLVDSGGTVTYYVIHKVTNGVGSSSFKIVAPEGWTRIGAVSEFDLNIGDIDQGITIAYSQCLSDQAIHIMTLTYQSPGNSPAGTVFKVLPHDRLPNAIEVVDCDLNRLLDGIGEVSPVIQP
jgi:hypothetical protein